MRTWDVNANNPYGTTWWSIKFIELILGGVNTKIGNSLLSTKIGMSTSVHALHVSCILDFEIRFSVLLCFRCRDQIVLEENSASSLTMALLLRNCNLCHSEKDNTYLHDIISYFLELNQFARTYVAYGWRNLDPATCYFLIISHLFKLN
jgi:hypothetical protein